MKDEKNEQELDPAEIVLIQSVIDGTASDAARDRLFATFKTDPGLRRVYEAQVVLHTMLSPGIAARLQAKLDALLAPSRPRFALRLPRFALALAAALLVCVVVAATTAVIISSGRAGGSVQATDGVPQGTSTVSSTEGLVTASAVNVASSESGSSVSEGNAASSEGGASVSEGSTSASEGSAKASLPSATAISQTASQPAATWTLANAADITNRVYFVGETIALPALVAPASYAVLGDAISVYDGATTISNTAPGFTNLRVISADLSMTNTYMFAVAPLPIGSGDVFYREVRSQSDNWSSTTAWTNLTRRTERLYPNAADDVAVVYGAISWWMLDVPSNGITIAGMVLGLGFNGTLLPKRSTKDYDDATLTFSRTDGGNAFLLVSTPLRVNKDASVLRLGNQNDSVNACVLTLSFTTPRFDIGVLNDSVGIDYARQTAFSIVDGALRIEVPAGQVLRFNDGENGSRLTDILNLTYSGTRNDIIGSGTIENVGFSAIFSRMDQRSFSGVFKETSYRAGGSRLYTLSSNMTVAVVGGFNTNGSPKTAISVGLETGSSVPNPGINMMPVSSLRLEGGQLSLCQVAANNGTWTNSATATNILNRLDVAGESTIFYGGSYGTARVVSPLVVQDLVRLDNRSTMSVHGFNLRSSNMDEWHGTCTISNFDALAEGVVGDPLASASYPIVPWMVVTANNNGYNYDYWGSENLFAAATNGVLVRAAHVLTLSAASTNDNVYFTDKVLGVSQDVTINSLAYETAQTPPYRTTYLGAGHTLTLKGGGMIFCTSTKYFGHPDNLEASGTVVFGGSCAYIHSGYGVATSASDDYNCMWAKIVATNDLVKGGGGQLVIAGDQRGIDGTIYVNAGVLWLGYPGFLQTGWLYANEPTNMWGACTDVTNFFVRGGAMLGISTNGFEIGGELLPTIGEDCALILTNSGLAEASVLLPAGVDMTCRLLTINGRSMPRGTYGATGSGANFIDDVHFSGTGLLTVTRDAVGKPYFYIRVCENDVAVPYDWVTNNCASSVVALGDVAVSNALVSSGANGLDRWQSYALGLDPNRVDSVVLCDARQDAAADRAVFVARNVVPVTNTAFTVNYVLEGSSDGVVWRDVAASPTNCVPVALPSFCTFFRIRADIVF